MQTNPPGTTVLIGNHTLTAAEIAAGVRQRDPFVDDDLVPTDPDEALVEHTDPDGVVATYRWPEAGPEDAGVLTRQETGRFFVAVTPPRGADGTHRWYLKGEMVLGSATPDQDVFCMQRDITRGP